VAVHPVLRPFPDVAGNPDGRNWLDEDHDDCPYPDD